MISDLVKKHLLCSNLCFCVLKSNYYKLLCSLPSTPMSAHVPQGGNVCIVCLHPPQAHTLIYIYVLHLHIWIKHSLAVHLHCNMLTETTISCFL